MKKTILKLARKKFSELSKKYDSFINVTVDDWRGYRFVFDTVDVRRCKNDCANCPLYRLLKNEKTGLFSAGLYAATAEDKALFGPQNFLNCKTLQQYQDCYVNFLLKRCRTGKEVADELKLVKNMRLIFSKEDDVKKLERQFKEGIIRRFKKSS